MSVPLQSVDPGAVGSGDWVGFHTEDDSVGLVGPAFTGVCGGRPPVLMLNCADPEGVLAVLRAKQYRLHALVSIFATAGDSEGTVSLPELAETILTDLEELVMLGAALSQGMRKRKGAEVASVAS